MNDPNPSAPRWSTSTMRHASASANLSTGAAALASHGIPVFPCVPGGKQPLTRRGFHDASADPGQVRDWWQRTPQANIGLPSGQRSGVVVLDVDVHAAGSGYPAFQRARAAGLVDGWGWLVRTPSGGLHAYFPTAPAAEQRSWQVPREHVDFRGDGGYVVAPPSQIVGADGVPRRYEVLAVAQHDPRPLDAGRLRALLDPPRPPGPPTALSGLGSRPDKLAAWVAARPEGARNHGLFWAACRMAEDGHRLQAILAALGQAARAAGLPDREAETTIRSAYRIAGPPPARGPDSTWTVEAVSL